MATRFDPIQAWFDEQAKSTSTAQQKYDKWARKGFYPTQRAMDADAYIASRNPRDHPDEFTWVGSMGYVYTGPARFYTSDSEHTAWLNSKLSSKPMDNGVDAARAIDNNPSVPKVTAPIDEYVSNTAPPSSSGYTLDDINSIYLEILGREETRTDHLNYWLNELEKNGKDLDWLRAAFKNTPEYAAKLERDNANTNTNTNTSTNTSTNTNTTTNTGGSTGPTIVGYYYASLNGSWRWFPYDSDETPPAGLPVVQGATMPSAPPAGYDENGPIVNNTNTNTNTNTGTNTNTTNTGGTANTGGGTTNTGGGAAPQPQGLFTPDASMFFKGMYTAGDLLRRDGGPVQSEYYNNARQEVLESLRQTALANGRTQNTQAEIQAAQSGTVPYSAGGLFDPATLMISRNFRF